MTSPAPTDVSFHLHSVTPSDGASGDVYSRFPGPFPPEVLNLVVASILHPQDLVPVALAQRSFYDVVSPYHLNYRYVECRLIDGQMWHHLKENTRRLNAVRFLHLEEPPHSTVPEIDHSVGAPDKQALPPSLLSCMVDLYSFRWDGSGIPGDMSVEEGDRYRMQIWKAVALLPGLQEIAVSGWFHCKRCGVDVDAGISPIYGLTCLKMFDHTFQCPVTCPANDYSYIDGLLLNNPKLEYLRLHNKNTATAGNLRRVELNHLRALSLSGFAPNAVSMVQAGSAEKSSLSELHLGGTLNVDAHRIRSSLGIAGLVKASLLTVLDFEILDAPEPVRFKKILASIVSACSNLRYLAVVRLAGKVSIPPGDEAGWFRPLAETPHLTVFGSPCKVSNGPGVPISAMANVTSNALDINRRMGEFVQTCPNVRLVPMGASTLMVVIGTKDKIGGDIADRVFSEGASVVEKGNAGGKTWILYAEVMLSTMTKVVSMVS